MIGSILPVVFLAALVGPASFADTIVLKNGRRITAASVAEENGRVSYEIRSGRLSLPRSIVERIEYGGLPPADAGSNAAAELPLSAPPVEAVEKLEEVARAAIHDGSIDRSYIIQLEDAARGGDAAAVARVVAAHNAAARFELGRGGTEQSIEHYRRALAFAPQQLGLLLNVAYLHLRRSEFTTALEYLERARRVAPDSADVAKLAGWAFYGLNRIDQAVEEWRHAQQVRPDAEVERALEKAERDQQVESSFREGETSHFTLRYHGGATPQLARDILRMLEGHFRAMESELNFTPSEPIGVILYTEEAFADITRAPAWVGALNDGRIRVPVQGLTSVPADLSRVLRHELTHSFIQQKTGGHCPVWVQEGVAQWMEGKRSAESAALLVTTYERKSAAPLAALEGSWMQFSNPAAGYAYAWALGVVEYIVQKGGMRDIERLLDRIVTEPSTEAAARSALHMDYAELELATVRYLRRAYFH